MDGGRARRSVEEVAVDGVDFAGKLCAVDDFRLVFFFVLVFYAFVVLAVAIIASAAIA